MIPNRSILSVPGHRASMHKKAAGSAADVVMIDLEDSVPLSEKDQARETAAASIRKLDWKTKAVACRINAVDTPFAYQDLIHVVEQAGDKLYTIVVPKIDHPGDLHFVDRLLQGIELRSGLQRKIGIEASIESAAGMANIRRIVDACDRLVSLVFGIADYSASIGAPLVSVSGHGENEESIYPGHRWHYAMSRLVMAAKSAGISAIDAPYGNFRDIQGLETGARWARSLGFDGKWAIHPGQIERINSVFSPTEEEIDRAKRVMDAFETAKKEGKGAIAIDGRMVDHATIRLAERVLKKIKWVKRDRDS